MPKLIKCEVCGEFVNKRQTLHIGNGERACKKHKNVTEQAEKEQAKVETKHAETRRPKINPYRQESDGTFDFCPRCCICHNKGMHAQQFYARLLVEREKYTLTTGKFPNLFNHTELHEYKGSLKDTRCLFFVTKEKILKAKIKLLRDEHDVLELLGVILVCADCISSKGIDNPLPEISFDKLESMALLGELIREPIQKLALDELSKDNQTPCGSNELERDS